MTIQDKNSALEVPEDFEEDASGTPHVHLLRVVSVGQQTLRRSVPAGGDVLGVRRFGVDAPAGAEVCQLQHVILSGKHAKLAERSKTRMTALNRVTLCWTILL